MKKVIHYIPGNFLEVTENWIYEQIKNNNNFTPIIYTNTLKNKHLFEIKETRIFPKKFQKEKFFSIFLNRLFFKFFNIEPRILSQALSDKAKIIHAHFGYGGAEIMFLKKTLKIPLITTFYGQDLTKLPKESKKWLNLYKKLFLTGDIFLVEGSKMKKNLIKLGCPSGKIIINHLGINTKIIKFKPRTIGENGVIKILISARFVKKKGIPNAIEAIGKIKKEHQDIKIKISIIGDCNNTEESLREKKEIILKIKKYKLEKITDLKGFKSHSFFVKELYKNHIYVQASKEGLNGDSEGGAPVSIIEASCSGMPVVGSTHCDIPEVIIDKKTGLLAKENDVEDLKSKILLLIQNPYQWKDYGLSGRKHVENNYDSIKQGKKLSKIYNSLI